MAIGISEIAGVHEAVVFYRIDVDGAAIRGGRVAHRINGVAAVARQGPASLRSTFLAGWGGS